MTTRPTLHTLIAALCLSASQLIAGGLPGKVIGTPGSWGNGTSTIAKVFDSNINTYYDAVNSSGDWAGLDLGSAKTITGIRYCPRSGWGGRMVGGRFQGANVADFSSGVVTFFTISTQPSDAVLTSQRIDSQTSFRYVRYIGPDNAYCNVAEVEFYDSGIWPVTLFADLSSYGTWADPNFNDINEYYNNSQRQSGIFRQTPYTEAAVTAAGGAYNSLTQINSSNQPNSLLLATDPAHGQGFTWVSPNQDFAAFSAQGVKVTNIMVSIAPLGPGSATSSDHWAALVFGAAAGSVVTNTGTGVLIRNGGTYQVFDKGARVFSGNAGASQFYNLDFQINQTSGAYKLLINGNAVYSGTHSGGYLTNNYITLESHNTLSDTGIQNDYFQNLQILGFQPKAVANTKYYVSSTGNDTNSGTSSSTPWKTLLRANVEQFQPGDQMLLQGGQTFNGYLNITDSGAPGSPITIGSYGTGNATITANGANAITLIDTHDITIQNLTLSGANGSGDGICFFATGQKPILSNFNITRMDVEGFNNGIHFYGQGQFQNLAITYSTLAHNANDGIYLETYTTDVLIDHDTISQNGYIGFEFKNGFYCVVQYCVVDHNGAGTGTGAGLSWIGAGHVLVQYNELYNNGGAPYGEQAAIRIDVGNYDIIQYNYTHDNPVTAIVLQTEQKGDGSGSYGSGKAVIRYNVSVNDNLANQGAWPSSFRLDTVYNVDEYANTIYQDLNRKVNDIFESAVLFTATDPSDRFFNNLVVSPVAVQLWTGASSQIFSNVFSSGDPNSPQVAFWPGAHYVTDINTFRADALSFNGGNDIGPVGKIQDPALVQPGQDLTINNPEQLATLTGYMLQPGSPLRSSGQDLSIVQWDPYNFAGDPFLGEYFSTNRVDFYGNPLPAAGSGQFSIGAHQLNLDSLPSAPSGLSVIATSSAVDLSWYPSARATSYNVWRSTTPGGLYTSLTNISSTNFQDTAVSNGATYYYAVSAASTAGTSFNSEPASSTWLVLPLDGVSLQGATNILTFPTTPGISYQMVYKDNLTNALWQVLPPGFFTATGTVATVTDPDASSHDSRFYGLQVATDSQSGLSAPWSSGPEGLVGIPGNATFSNNIYTVNGSGADIGSVADAFQFVSQPISGDCALIAKVASVQNIDPWSKAGVMIRQSLNPGAPNAFVTVTPGHGVSFQYGTTQGGNTSVTSPRSCAAPYWVKVVRSGNTFTGFSSPNGVNWTQEGSVTIAMPSTVYAGLAVSSHNSESLCAATFTNVELTGAFKSADIGGPGIPGGVSLANGVYTVSGSGADIWGTSDQFQYVYAPASGDCDIIAKVLSVQNTDVWAKAGVMIRETLSANAQYADVVITPGSGASYQYRNSTGGGCDFVQSVGITAPYWVRVTRTGNNFKAYICANGTSWTQVGATQAITMSTNVYIGLCVTSHNNSKLSTATFSNVTATP